MLNLCPLSAARAPTSAPAACAYNGDAEQLALFDTPLHHETFDPGDPVVCESAPLDWSEEDLVLLHWRLLEELRHLQHAETPLEEKIDTLNWVFTDPDKDNAPFSFVRCVQVVGRSPLSPTPYFGAVDPESIRDWIRANAPRWMRATIERYPHWVGEEIRADPEHVVRQIDRNPQWINEEIKKRSEFGDFFA
jgi:hypothetical protein